MSLMFDLFGWWMAACAVVGVLLMIFVLVGRD